MHITIVQYINQRFIIREYFHSHHHLIYQLRLIGNETTQTIVITQIYTQCFSNIDSCLLSTINKDIGTMTSIEIQKFIKHLHNNARARHHGKTNNICHEEYAHRCQANIHVA